MAGWQWARICITGLRFLGVYGKDEHGWVFHAVVDLAATPDPEVAYAAHACNFEAFAIWRLGPHESIAPDERLPPHLLAMKRLAYDDATALQTIVLVLTSAEVRLFGLPQMDG